MGLKSSSTGGGEIVQVQGGHIIRATGRKDRHSKVFTAKGPRDRRVRLSAHTAIQFYDVQDRLGYDRPSKAVDWLMKKAKASIDKLAELPPWDPTASAPSTVASVDDVNGGGGCTEFHVGDHSGSSSFYAPQPQCVGPHHQSLGGSSDSMKSFFPMNDDTNHVSGENSISFQNYPHGLISRGSAQNQDLCLSLHTLQDPSGSARGGGGHHHQNMGHDSMLFHGSGSSLGFECGPSGWVEPHQPHDLGRFSRMLGWPMRAAGATTVGGGAGNSGGGDDSRGGNFFNPPPFPQQGLLLGQQGPISTTTYSQRGTLQSSFSPLVRVLEDQQHHQHQPEIHNIVHASSDGFMGFYIPSEVHGHELHDGANSMSNRASSSSLSPDSSQH